MTSGSLTGSVPADQFVRLVGEVGDVIDLTHDSRQVEPGWAFGCVVGEHLDGHTFAGSAVASGASVLIVDRHLPFDVPQIIVRDVRRAIGPIAASIHGGPSRQLTTVGITGTNGKTTTTFLLGSILRSAGRETREMGTLSGVRTTPEASDLQRRLAGFVADRVDAVAMEVSSHALALHRVDGTRFDVAVFTNLGRDHLDLHESMEAYFRAKASLFMPDLSDVGVTNIDDPNGRLLLDVAAIDMVGFSESDASDVTVEVDKLRFTWRGRDVRVPLGGRFNVMNSLAALTTADVLGIELDAAIAGIASCQPVPGRFEVVSDPNRESFAVVVDYAHTPDGIREVLTSARQLAIDGRVIVVFGCGGGRDAEKRPLMGSAAAAGADVVIVTSDNPRHEDPVAIVKAAAAGAGGANMLITEVDRRAAIEIALRQARLGDVVVIAGKGHETTQTIGDTALPFDDRQVARELLQRLEDQS